MRIKWYIFSLVFSLTLLSVLQNGRAPEANQEIVLQVADNAKSASETKQTIAEISETLYQFGIEAVSVTKSGELYRISYYSDISVKQIKNLLSEQTEIIFNKTSEKSKSPKKYNFDIFKIESGQVNSWDFEGTQVSVVHFKSDRSQQLDVFKFPLTVEAGQFQTTINVVLNINRNVVSVSDNTSHNIPEVRAGPFA